MPFAVASFASSSSPCCHFNCLALFVWQPLFAGCAAVSVSVRVCVLCVCVWVVMINYI